MSPQLIFGTATFGMDLTEFQDASSVQTLLENLQDLGFHRLDSGARYPPLKPGRAEELLGETKELSGKFIIDTKVYTNTKTDGSGDLTSEAIETSVEASLQRLKKPDGVRPTLMSIVCTREEFFSANADSRSTSSTRIEPTLPRHSKSRFRYSISRSSKVAVRL